MKWWSFFRKIRKVIFAFIAITGLAWVAILSIYLVKEWDHFTILQRSIVIAMISVNGITTVIQYLMIVCVFRIWVDFARTLFLLAIHVAASVLYTLFGGSFSCEIFSSKTICNDVELAFLAGSWATTGLCYAIFLCIMSRIPFPIPVITPNLLLSANPSPRSSTASINSASRLLGSPQSSNRSPQSRWSGDSNELRKTQKVIQYVNQRQANRTSPKKLFVVNGLPSPISPEPVSVPEQASRAHSRMRSGGSYGAMGSPRVPLPSTTISSTSSGRSATSSPIPASLRSATNSPAPSSMRQNSIARMSRTFSQKRTSRPQALPLLNPFMDPMSRNGTPDSTYSAFTYNSSSSTATPGSFGQQYLSPYHVPPLSGIQEKDGPQDAKEPESPSSIYSLYSTYSSTDSSNEQSISHVILSPYDPRTSPTMKSTISSPPRTHTATLQSVHSVAPSVHFQSEQRVPPMAHIRAFSDPVYRSYTASPRLVHEPTEAPLPNPFPMVGAELRRYASIGNERDLEKGVYGPVQHTQSARNAAHFQAALGRSPPRTAFGYGPPAYHHGHGVAPVVTRSQWKQLVLSAAAAGR
ncbi:unnamed protein product [Somion occarium]|uniref:Integral membrane protein n=1 Tax=Somion occarium TaxID=3059160 RepID=A0ABP1DD12_9APHY